MSDTKGLFTSFDGCVFMGVHSVFFAKTLLALHVKDQAMARSRTKETQAGGPVSLHGATFSLTPVGQPIVAAAGFPIGFFNRVSSFTQPARKPPAGRIACPTLPGTTVCGAAALLRVTETFPTSRKRGG